MTDFTLTTCEDNVTGFGVQKMCTRQALVHQERALDATAQPQLLAHWTSFFSPPYMAPAAICILLRVQPHPGSTWAPAASTAPKLQCHLHAPQTGASTWFTTDVHEAQLSRTLALRYLDSMPSTQTDTTVQLSPTPSLCPSHKVLDYLNLRTPPPNSLPPYFDTNHAPDLFLCLQFPTQDLLHGSGDKSSFHLHKQLDDIFFFF